MPTRRLKLTGKLTTPDAFGRIRLLLIDRLESESYREDHTWETLLRAVPLSARRMPYRFFNYANGECHVDEGGVRGEALLTIPGPSRHATLDKAAWLKYSAELRSQEVEAHVLIKNYSFVSTAEHNRGERVTGTALYIEHMKPLARHYP